MIVLDSDVLIEILNPKSERGIEMFNRVLANGQEIITTAINLHEVAFGLHKRGKPINSLVQFSILDFTRKDSMLSSELELALERIGKPIMRTDTMVAAITMNNNATLCTFNLKHFEPLKSKGLKLF
jgi:predicted nucleic acid-binding protein